MMRVGGGVRKVKGLDNLTPFGTPRDVVDQTSFGDGTKKVGNSPKNGETSQDAHLRQGQVFLAT